MSMPDITADMQARGGFTVDTAAPIAESFSTHLLEKAGVLCTPGNGFGVRGEG